MGIEANLAAVRTRIQRACEVSGRDPGEVRLLAVSKTMPAADIRAAYGAGQRDFGESRVQELDAKADQLADLADLSWSMIGHVQTNKIGDVARVADEVQSLDSIRLAHALDHRLSAVGRSLRVLVQVNTSGESSKSGLAVDEVVPFVRELASLPLLQPVGLMTIAMLSDDSEAVSGCFETLAALRREVEDVSGHAWPELSMGMSGDLEHAIAAGSTCVRVGTAIFGVRS